MYMIRDCDSKKVKSLALLENCNTSTVFFFLMNQSWCIARIPEVVIGSSSNVSRPTLGTKLGDARISIGLEPSTLGDKYAWHSGKITETASRMFKKEGEVSARPCARVRVESVVLVPFLDFSIKGMCAKNNMKSFFMKGKP